MGLSIYDNPNLKRGHREGDDLKALLTTIDQLPFYIGAKPFGENEMPVVLIANFIMRRYPMILPEDIVEAFEMAAAGELWLDGRRVSAKTFGNEMGIELVGTILTAWRERKAAKQAAPKATIPETHRIAARNEMPTPAWHYESMMVEVTKTGHLPEFRAYGTIHAYMVAKGMLNELQPMQKRYYRGTHIRSLSDELKSDPHRMAIMQYLIKKNIIKKTTDEDK